MAVRVVCGLSATIATFCPTRAFSSADFPAFGRPIRETNPDLKVLFIELLFETYRCGLANANLAHAQLIADQHFHANSVAFHRLPWLGHAAEPFADQAADGSGFDVLFGVEGHEEIGDAVQVKTSGDDETAAAVLGDIAIRLVLIADLADDHLQQVFHGGQAGRRSEE